MSWHKGSGQQRQSAGKQDTKHSLHLVDFWDYEPGAFRVEMGTSREKGRGQHADNHAGREMEMKVAR